MKSNLAGLLPETSEEVMYYSDLVLKISWSFFLEVIQMLLVWRKDKGANGLSVSHQGSRK